jgi:NTE family protein
MTQEMPLGEIPLFAALSDSAKAEFLSVCELREYSAGDVILAPGEIGRFLYAIARGTVSVRPDSAYRQLAITLGPGEVFGELSLLSRTPVSAEVIAASASRIYVVAAHVFDQLFADEPGFRKSITDLLANRLRLRTSNRNSVPTCALIGLPSSEDPLSRSVLRGVDHYVRVTQASHLAVGGRGIRALGEEIDRWRASAHGGEVYIAALPAAQLIELRAHTRPGDAAILVDDGTSLPELGLPSDWEVDTVTVRIGAAARRPGRANELWSYRLDDAEIVAAENASQWSGRTAPVLDSIARWIAGRTIGIALGAGSARGFAHIGVLRVLEAAGISVDYLSGSSMGGVIALLYAMSGSAKGAHDLARSTFGSNEMIRDVSIFPRSALLRGRKVRRGAERISGGKYFPDLTRPVAVVTSDLVTGQQIVLDRGLISSAAVATSAIPGVLPAVKTADYWLVDGALVSCVPVDLLRGWRCGLKIAVNVIGDVAVDGTELRAELRRAMNGVFGLGRVLLRSWELLGVAHAAAESQAADIVIEPRMHLLSGHNFGANDSFISEGTAAAERRLPVILEAFQKLTRPRAR